MSGLAPDGIRVEQLLNRTSGLLVWMANGHSEPGGTWKYSSTVNAITLEFCGEPWALLDRLAASPPAYALLYLDIVFWGCG